MDRVEKLRNISLPYASSPQGGSCRYVGRFASKPTKAIRQLQLTGARQVRLFGYDEQCATHVGLLHGQDMEVATKCIVRAQIPVCVNFVHFILWLSIQHLVASEKFWTYTSECDTALAVQKFRVYGIFYTYKNINNFSISDTFLSSEKEIFLPLVPPSSWTTHTHTRKYKHKEKRVKITPISSCRQEC